jgi:hypothetical protein
MDNMPTWLRMILFVLHGIVISWMLFIWSMLFLDCRPSSSCINPSTEFVIRFVLFCIVCVVMCLIDYVIKKCGGNFTIFYPSSKNYMDCFKPQNADGEKELSVVFWV